jgi:flavin-dependent dehydrogenase
LAGLITSIRLARQNISCLVIEKNKYPFHRVCGEYISNETIPFLKSEDLYPDQLKPVQINEFQLSSVTGKTTRLPLDLGGFGISRFAFDNFLFEKALNSGVEFLQETEVQSVSNNMEGFEIKTSDSTHLAQIVVGAFGKRSKLDAGLNRKFFKKKSPYVGVKYHVRTQHPSNLIALHNFRGGYCGISNVEDGKTNLCYLTHRNNLKKIKSIKEMEEKVLYQNPFLCEIFSESEFLFDKPETISEISFETKEPVWNHILMTGDAAGMIAPLCGNGMAMAIHSAKILSELITKHLQSKTLNQALLEKEYEHAWNTAFVNRLWMGRLIQNHLFTSEWSSNFAVMLALHSKAIARQIIKKTHGKPF